MTTSPSTGSRQGEEDSSLMTSPEVPISNNAAPPTPVILSDEERLQRIKEILRYQLDLEILHKWRELKVIEGELERGCQLKTLLEKLILNEYVYGFTDGGSVSASGLASSSRGTTPSLSSFDDGLGFKRRARSVVTSYAHSHSHSYSGTPTSASASASGTPKERVQAEPHPQYEVRPDGTIVRMRCPKCGADKFRSMLGFLNHCRIHCRLVFSSQDDRLQRCGVPVEDPNEVPSDYFTKHPTQLKQEMDLALIRADVLGPVNDTLRKPAINIEDLTQRVHGDDGMASGSGVGLGVGGGVGLGEEITGSHEAQYAGISMTASSLNGRKSNSVSRFKVKKQIIIGNAAKSLHSKNATAMEQEEDSTIPSEEGRTPTHKWRIFLKNLKHVIPNPDDDLRSFIRCVRFVLHPSYRPHDVIDVMEPPFELSRLCWGEFPVRIQIHFWDPRNKPIEIVHLIRVLTATTGKYTITAEQIHDIELDRRTDFSIGNREKDLLPPLTLSAPPKATAAISDEDVLTMAIGDFPLYGRKGKRAANARYRPVGSLEEFLRLDYNSQMALEVQRATALTKHLMTSFPTFSQTIEEVVTWCRDNRYTPAAVASLVSEYEKTELVAEKLLYCRFCGVAHLPQDRFDILQKNCSSRPRKIHVSSRTASADLVAKYRLHPENSDVVKKLKQDYLASTSYAIPAVEVPPNGRVLFGPDASDDELLGVWVRLQLEALIGAYASRFDGSNTFLMACLRVFLEKFLMAAVKEIPDSKERSAERPSLLTPLHLFNMVTSPSHRQYDFLTNAYMLGGGGGGGSSTSPAAASQSPENQRQR